MNHRLHVGVDVLGYCHMGVVRVYHKGYYKMVGTYERYFKILSYISGSSQPNSVSIQPTFSRRIKMIVLFVVDLEGTARHRHLMDWWSEGISDKCDGTSCSRLSSHDERPLDVTPLSNTVPRDEQVFDECLLKNGMKKERGRGRNRDRGKERVKGRKKGMR